MIIQVMLLSGVTSVVNSIMFRPVAEKTLDVLLPNTFTMFKKKTASTDDYQVHIKILCIYIAK